MKAISTLATVVSLLLAAGAASAQALIDKGFVAGWHVMVDPSFGNGCLIQTTYQDLSVVRIGYDATANRGYFVVFNKAWGNIKKGQTYPIRFDLDGERFDETATGFYLDKIPGAGVFFKDREFIHAIAQRRHMIVYGQDGREVMAIDLKGSAKALDYARQCQDAQR